MGNKGGRDFRSSEITDWNDEEKIIPPPSPVVKLWNRYDLLEDIFCDRPYREYYYTRELDSKPFKVNLLKEGYTKQQVEDLENHLHPSFGNKNRKICIRLKELFNKYELEPLLERVKELKFNSLENEYPKEYRNCKRTLVKSKPMADAIWERIKPMLKVSDFKDLRPYGFDNEGLWKPIGINDVLRISKYEKGGYFKPHMDGQFVLDDNHKSILTVLIYLVGDEYSGGTNFYHCIEKKDTSLVLQNILTNNCHIGDCLLFNHEIYHSGEIVEYTPKYILRTEIIFQRVDVDNVSRTDYQASEEYKAIKNLVEESARLEKEGNIEKSTQVYLEAQHLQLSVSSNIQSSNPSFLESTLPTEVLSLIFSYLSPIEVCKCVLYLNRNLNASARDQFSWKQRYREEWGEVSSTGFDYNSRIMKMEQDIFNDTTDWFNLFVTRKNLDRDFCALIVNPGPNYFRYALKSDVDMRYEISYCGIGRHSHFFFPGQGLNDLFLGNAGEQVFSYYDPVDLFTNQEAVDPVILSCFIEHILRKSLGVNLQQHPILFAKPFAFLSEDEEKLKDILFGAGIPAIHIEYSYSLISLFYGLPNCTIIDLLPDYVCVSIVENGQPCLDDTLFSPELSTFKQEIKAGYDMNWPNSFTSKIAKIKNEEEEDNISTKLANQYMFGEKFYTTILPFVNEFLRMLERTPQNVIIRGEMSRTPGLVTRLTKDISEQFANRNFIFTHDPENCVWDILKGGKIRSNLSDFKGKCQYREYYEQICHPSQFLTLDEVSQKIKMK